MRTPIAPSACPTCRTTTTTVCVSYSQHQTVSGGRPQAIAAVRCGRWWRGVHRMGRALGGLVRISCTRDRRRRPTERPTSCIESASPPAARLATAQRHTTSTARRRRAGDADEHRRRRRRVGFRGRVGGGAVRSFVARAGVGGATVWFRVRHGGGAVRSNEGWGFEAGRVGSQSVRSRRRRRRPRDDQGCVCLGHPPRGTSPHDAHDATRSVQRGRDQTQREWGVRGDHRCRTLHTRRKRQYGRRTSVSPISTAL